MNAGTALLLSMSLCVAAARAQRIVPGSACPPLQIAEWLKGEAVESLADGHVHVIEFWASWCGPSLAAIPRLSRLQRKWRDKDVVVIGVTTVDPKNTLDGVRKLVEDMGSAIDYRIAWDDQSKTKDTFLVAAGQSSLPCAFVVDGKGQVAFVGHPSLLDVPVAGIVAGTWDPVAGQKRILTALQRLAAIPRELQLDTEASRSRVGEFTKEFPEFAERVRTMEFQQLLAAGKFERAYQLGNKIVDAAIAAKDAETLDDIARPVVDPTANVGKRDLDLALRAATIAVELTRERDGQMLDTLARTWSWRGDHRRAFEIQEKAVACGGTLEFATALEDYRRLMASRDPK